MMNRTERFAAFAVEGRPLVLRWAQLLLPIALLTIGFMSLATPARNPGNSYAFGCDPFGYLRGAQLFQEKGLAGGFDTAIDRADTRYLVEIAKSLGRPVATWATGVAPHCHHYDAGSDQVILQYPPGTSLLLALFPYGTGGQHSFTIAIGLATMAMLYACFLYHPRAVTTVLLGGALLATIEMLRIPMNFASFSIPWSVAFIPGCALAALRLLEVTGARQLVVGMLLGLMCGVLVLIRLPNIFVVAGLGLFLLLEGRLWTWRAWTRNGFALVAGSAMFLASGLGVLAMSQWVNTGSPFQLSYAAEDVNRMVLSWAGISDNIDFYFRRGDDAVFVDGTLAFLGFALARAIPRSGRALRNAVAASLFVMVVTTAFFLIYSVTAPYYLVPASVLAVFLVSFAWCRLSAPRFTVPAPLVASILFGFACLIGVRMKASDATPFPMKVPQEVLAPDAVVWSDIMSGSLLFYNDKFAAKLPFVHRCVRTELVKAIFDAGRPQYFVIDSELMRGNVSELAASTEPVGVYDVHEPFPILRLTGVKPPPDYCPR
ncbi:MAG: rane protein of unknown function [Rhodospirillales bacterium]|nr:rane protein of unknown function [Rhodospirillales bacterium]